MQRNKASNAGEPNVDRRRSELPLFRKNRYRSATARLNARRGSEQYPPMNSSMARSAGLLRTHRERIDNSISANVPNPGTGGSSSDCACSPSSADVPYWRPLCHALSMARNEYVGFRNAVSERQTDQWWEGPDGACSLLTVVPRCRAPAAQRQPHTGVRQNGPKPPPIRISVPDMTTPVSATIRSAESLWFVSIPVQTWAPPSE